MFGNPPIRYEYISFMDTINDPALSSITETNINKLAQLIRECDLDNAAKMGLALKYAKKMAIFHGVPGLIHYINLQIKIMEKYKQKNERVDQQCFNTLCYLKLAKLIYDENPNIMANLEQILPDENIKDKNYWTVKEAMINGLCDMSHQDNEATKVALGMFKQGSSMDKSTKNNEW